eukprot:SAG31_NODE_3521_length_4163_cov_4.411663_4_plen_143_part_00
MITSRGHTTMRTITIPMSSACLASPRCWDLVERFFVLEEESNLRRKEFAVATAPLDGLEKTRICKRVRRLKSCEHVSAPLFFDDAVPRFRICPIPDAKQTVCLNIPCYSRLRNSKVPMSVSHCSRLERRTAPIEGSHTRVFP